MSPSYDAIVVGSGAAGCVAANQLSADPRRRVLLLEAGPDTHHPGVDWFAGLSQTANFIPHRTVRRTPQSPVTPYLSGNGVGGSARVNGMIAMPGLAADFDSWGSDYGCHSWRSDQLGDVLAALRTAYPLIPESLGSSLDRALLGGAAEIGQRVPVDLFDAPEGAGMLRLAAHNGERKSSVERFLRPALERDNLALRSGSAVARVEPAGRSGVRVITTDGESILGRDVVLCAGAFETPAILHRSEIRPAGLGHNLRDHAAITIPLHLANTSASTYWMASALRASSLDGYADIGLFPFHRPAHGHAPPTTFLMVALMTCESRGQLTFGSPDQPAAIHADARLLTDPSDAVAFDDAIDTALCLIDTAAFANVAEPADPGQIRVLRGRAERAGWLARHLDGFFHACGTARMGTPDDPLAVTDEHGKVLGTEGIYAMDASIMPTIPRAPTHVTTTLIAYRLAAHLAAS